MTSIMRKLLTVVALLVAGGLVIGGTMAFASGSSTPIASIASGSSTSSASGSEIPTPGASVGSDDDDGTPDQGPGDFPFEDGGADDDDDNSGPSENSGPGSVDDDDDNSGHGGDED
jgi:hypothetical protein